MESSKESGASGAPFKAVEDELASSSWLAEGDWLCQLESAISAFGAEEVNYE